MIELPEMPPQVAALPRTDTGWPVTWAAAWTSELSVEVRPESLLEPVMGVAPNAYFSGGQQGVGDPCITLPNPQRVRRSTIEGICQVCGHRIGRGPRWVCDIRLGEESFRFNGLLVPLLIDSWTCDGCIKFSLRVCPNLMRRCDLDVLRVATWLAVPTLERPKWFADSIPYGPIGFVKIAAVEYQRFSAAELSVD